MTAGLLPLFRILFNVLGTIGQAITLVLSAIEPAIVAIEQIFAAIYGALQPVLETIVSILAGVLSTAFKAISSIILQLTPYILAAAKGLQLMFEWLEKAVRELFALIGIELPEFAKPKPGAAVGAAVAQGVNISGAERPDVIQTALKNAFKGTSAVKEDPIVKVAALTEGLLGKADDIFATMVELFGEVSSIGRDALSIYKWILRVPDEIWAKLPDWLQSLLKAIEKFFSRFGGKDLGNAAKFEEDTRKSKTTSPIWELYDKIKKTQGAA
jgi:hypothetical protein